MTYSVENRVGAVRTSLIVKALLSRIALGACPLLTGGYRIFADVRNALVHKVHQFSNWSSIRIHVLNEIVQ